VEQKTDFSCGAAALATILRQAYWLDVDEEHIIKGMLVNADQNLVRTQGFSMLDMKRYLESIGMRARGYKIAPDTLVTVKIPVVVLLGNPGLQALRGAAARRQRLGVYRRSRAGSQALCQGRFIKGWNGIVFAVLGEGYDKANVLLDPPTPLTAKNKLNEFSPVRDSELMDFGFIQSDFF